MNLALRTLLYGIIAFVVFSGISYTLEKEVNWPLATGTAVGIMIVYYFILFRRQKERDQD